MGKKQTTTQTNQYEYKAPPPNPSYQQADAYASGIDSTINVRNQYGQSANQIRESGNEFYGANTSAEVRDKVRQNRLFRNTTDMGKSLLEAKQSDDITKMNFKMGLGQATAPQLIQTGGTSVQKTPFDWGGLAGSLIGGGAQLGSAAMAPGAQF